MKNALILHGTSDTSKGNWFWWLKTQLDQHGWQTYVPDLPHAEAPRIPTYNKFLLNTDWDFNNESILIGHSSGAVAILGLLQALPDEVTVDTCYLVGAFKDDLGWKSLAGLFETPFDFEKIKSKAKKFIFLHSDNDPYCPLEHAQYLAKRLESELIIKPGQKHFSVGTAGEHYKQFPFLLSLIEESET